MWKSFSGKDEEGSSTMLESPTSSGDELFVGSVTDGGCEAFVVVERWAARVDCKRVQPSMSYTRGGCDKGATIDGDNALSTPRSTRSPFIENSAFGLTVIRV